MKIYDILLHTPIGKREGELTAKIENRKIKGFLSLFGNVEPLEGTVDENGGCSLKGKFVTLMKTVDFTANGTINYEVLHLAIKGDCGYYEMVGALRNAKEANS